MPTPSPETSSHVDGCPAPGHRIAGSRACLWNRIMQHRLSCSRLFLLSSLRRLDLRRLRFSSHSGTSRIVTLKCWMSLLWRYFLSRVSVNFETNEKQLSIFWEIFFLVEWDCILCYWIFQSFFPFYFGEFIWFWAPYISLNFPVCYVSMIASLACELNGN